VQVYAVDLRHHGDSSSVPARGYHIARLAADLRDFLEALKLTDVTGTPQTLFEQPNKPVSVGVRV
jgi:pimeloyl-ACP methyl ester carboxylesterase